MTAEAQEKLKNMQMCRLNASALQLADDAYASEFRRTLGTHCVQFPAVLYVSVTSTVHLHLMRHQCDQITTVQSRIHCMTIQNITSIVLSLFKMITYIKAPKKKAWNSNC